MNAKETLEQKYLSIGRLSGSTLLLSHQDALHFIQDCRNLGLVILGMEFFITDGEYHIALTNGADDSSLYLEPHASESTTSEALNLIRERLPDHTDLVTFHVVEPKC